MDSVVKRNAPIGVFDSGVGGLTVTREIMRQLPNENLVYFGDTARVPYGSKSKDTVIRYSSQIINFLKTKNVKAIVVACNTASALALDIVKQETEIPMSGVIVPGAKMAAKTTKNKKIGVIATEATIGSEIYNRVIGSIDDKIEVTGISCPLFVPLVEEGFAKHKVTEEIIEHYLKGLKTSDVDTLILGCTHYPLLRTKIAEYLGEEIHLVNPAYETATSLKEFLEKENLTNNDSRKIDVTYEFYVSDAADRFKQFANSILPYDIEKTQQINIEEF